MRIELLCVFLLLGVTVGSEGFLNREMLKAGLPEMVGSEYIGRGYDPNFNVGVRNRVNFLYGLKQFQPVVKLNFSANIQFNGQYQQQYSCPKGIQCANATSPGLNQENQFHLMEINDFEQVANFDIGQSKDEKEDKKEFKGYRSNSYTRDMIEELSMRNISSHIMLTDREIYQLQVKNIELHPWFVGNVSSLTANLTNYKNSTNVSTQYNDFIKKFGTHYVSQVYLGGRYSYSKQVKLNSNFNNQSLIANLTYRDYALSKSNNFSEWDYDLVENKTIQLYQSYSSDSIAQFIGGTMSTTMDQFYESIPWNPVPLRIVIKQISGLLNQAVFPTNPNIDAKREIFEYYANQSIANTPMVSCLNNCNGNGQCVPTNLFKVGQCQCLNNYEGPDCSIKVNIK